ncbi:MAG: hypothetical protein H0U23_07315 [Blastocatellia bacterium]|nr:hypothetical protein [Blastocatellia bacterium]
MTTKFEFRLAAIERNVSLIANEIVKEAGDPVFPLIEAGASLAGDFLADVASVANSLERIADLMERDIAAEIEEQLKNNPIPERKRSIIGKPVDGSEQSV